MVLFSIFCLLVACSAGVFLVPKPTKQAFSFVLALAMAVITSFWAIDVLYNNIPLELYFPILILEHFPRLFLDPLSAFFVLVINFTVLTGLLYSAGYLKPYLVIKNATQFSVHYFSYIWLYFSMLMVTMLRDTMGFLIVWELMSLSSFLLVIFDGENEDILKIGIVYFIQMHIAFICLVAGFVYAGMNSSFTGFDAVGEYFKINSNLPLFLLFFTGFGIKAGFMPLHTWLPHAHPAAPSHVSGVMSGVMIKMGIYGILRILLSVQQDIMEIGVFLLVVSIISGVLGVMMAIVQHDLKKLLAYHSIENIGIIGIGIGLGMIGKANENTFLAVLGFSGALLHTLNHSLFKSLLFYCAGSVYKVAHTRDINQLGGLIKKMPHTSLLFLLAALAICGLPPFNGFVSEFLIYSAMFKTLNGATLNNSLLMLAGILSLALIGGLAIFCFTKAFGISFLGSPRSNQAAKAIEVDNSMIYPKYAIALIIVAVGVLPILFVMPLKGTVKLYVPSGADVIASSSSTLLQISAATLLFYVACAILLAIRYLMQIKRTVAYRPTWGCGYSGANPAIHQYTATSFAENYKELGKPLLGLYKKYDSFEEHEIFPKPRRFETHAHDPIEENAIIRPVNILMSIIQRIAMIQTGRIQDYLIYAIAFLLFVFVLTVLKLI